MNPAPWLERAWAPLAAALRRGALPSAILLHGPEGLGKRALAARLAAAALCLEPRDGEACGRCRACTLGAAGTHPDLHRVRLEESSTGRLRQEITVGQVRALTAGISMTSQLGGRQLALIDPADRLNRAAANALLKTLEEPARDTAIILIADQAWRLPATVRSRCQAFSVPAPAATETLAWLQAQGVQAPEAALAAAGGNPGLARALAADGGLALHAAVQGDLVALAAGREDAFAVAARWADEQAPQRLWFAARAAADEARRRVRGEAVQLGPGLSTLALLDWYATALRAREDLRGPLQARPLLTGLLAAWR